VQNAAFIVDLQAEIDRKNEGLAQNAAFIADLQAEIDRKNEGLAQNAAFIADLQAEIGHKNADLVRDTDTIAQLRGENEQLKIEIERRAPLWQKAKKAIADKRTSREGSSLQR
jgi:predicted  nucleic acid-binding Zn-ribbon protein